MGVRISAASKVCKERNKVAVGPSDWMSVSGTGRWNDAPCCWKEDSPPCSRNLICTDGSSPLKDVCIDQGCSFPGLHSAIPAGSAVQQHMDHEHSSILRAHKTLPLLFTLKGFSRAQQLRRTPNLKNKVADNYN
ncbi:uncharacterized protein LOC143695372 [Agelaius phoeniceus]|uniref:uncharacterized protein LOC143695372 n=1 Tax=Agelaius phoeniceus TaxID=39638 RepID=UPI004054DEC6